MSKKLLLISPRQAFIGANTTSATRFPPLGLGYIAALTPRDWDVEILDETWGEIEYQEADLVGITAMTCQANRAYQIARIYKEKRIPVILGGMHPSMVPDEAVRYADSIVVGEADDIWPQVVKDAENKALSKVYKYESTVDLANLVIPRHDLFDKRYKVGIIQTTRGCPMNCEFCSVTAFNGFKYRKRPVQAVLNELNQINKPIVLFADDNLIGHSKEDERRFIELCQGMLERGIKKRWLAQVSTNFSRDEEVLRYAKKTGCLMVLLGIESVDEKVLSGTMNKKVNIKHLRDLEKIHKYGINIFGTFIVGNDDDTPETFNRLYQYIEEMQIDLPVINFLVPFPGTRLEKRLAEENRLNYRTFPEDWDIYNIGNRAMIDTENLSRQELHKNLKELYLRLYSYQLIFKRAFRAFLRTKSVFNFIFTFKSGMGWRGRFFNTAFFKDSNV